MLVKRISHLAKLASYADDWHRLSPGVPFVSWNWLSSWWTHYGAEHDLYVLLVEDQEKNVIGFAPWFIESSTTRGRQVKFLGSGHVCSDYMCILTRNEDIDRVAKAIALWLRDANDRLNDHNEADGWDFLSFEGVHHGDLSLLGLRRELEILGYRSDDEPTAACWRNELGDNWDSFLAKLPKKSRQKVRGIQRKLIDTGRTEFAYATNRDQFTDFYESFVRLHQKRRKSLGEPGCFASTEFAGFLRDVADHFLRRGTLLTSRLLIDGNLAAGSLGIVANGVHFMYQTGMNPDLSHQMPGWVMNVHHILYGYENDIQAIDFLRGDEPYKSKLGAERIEMVKFRIVANQAGAKVRNKLWQIRTNIRQNGLPTLGLQWGNSLDGEIPTGENNS